MPTDSDSFRPRAIDPDFRVACPLCAKSVDIREMTVDSWNDLVCASCAKEDREREEIDARQ